MSALIADQSLAFFLTIIKASRLDLGTPQKIYFTLRIASAMCFVGHGAFGIITKPIWENYFGVFGIGHHLSLQLMPVVGIVDIILGLALLLYPVKAVFIWLVMWGLMTALLRPLSGEPFAEFVERAGNFGDGTNRSTGR